MDGTIYCLVDAKGTIYVKDNAESHADVAADFGLDEQACQEYRFDLTARRLVRDRGFPASDRVVQAYLDQHVGTPEKLMEFAEEGRLPKHVLMNLLSGETKRTYLDACAAIEKKYTEECVGRTENDPCLETGCAMDVEEGEVCLQPLLKADVEYHKACAAEWIKIFSNPRNRIAPWRNQ